MSGIIAAALINGGATIYGSSQAAKSPSNSGNPMGAAVDPTLDPVLGGLSLESLVGLGSNAGIGPQLEAGTPINQLIAQINSSPNLRAKDRANAVSLVRFFADRGVNPFDDSPEAFAKIGKGAWLNRKYLQTALNAVGAGAPNQWDQLMQNEQTAQAKNAQFQAQIAPILDTIRTNRITAQGNLADIAANAGLRTNNLAALYEPQIAQQFQDERNNILQTANAGRFNPGAALGRLNTTQAQTQKTSAIERALQIMGGQVGITQSALAPAQQLALSTSNQRQGGQGLQLNAANIAASQLAASQQLQQQRNESMGTGIASAGGQIGNLGILYALLGQSSGPGSTPANNSVMANQAGYNSGGLDLLRNLSGGSGLGPSY